MIGNAHWNQHRAASAIGPRIWGLQRAAVGLGPPNAHLLRRRTACCAWQARKPQSMGMRNAQSVAGRRQTAQIGGQGTVALRPRQKLARRQPQNDAIGASVAKKHFLQLYIVSCIVICSHAWHVVLIRRFVACDVRRYSLPKKGSHP
jgi:hypothetical protein